MRKNDTHEQEALMKRAIRAAIVAGVVFGGVFVWHNLSAERTELRVEQAQQNALRLSEKKIDALAREAARDAAAQAFAEKQAAEREAPASMEAAEQTPTATQSKLSPTEG